MFSLDDITNEKNDDHNKKWPYIPDHPNRIQIEVLDQEKQMHYVI